jgi:PEP-CTERM motif
MRVAVLEARILADLLDDRRGRADPLDGLAQRFLAEIQAVIEAPWANAVGDLVYPDTIGERPPDLATRLCYGKMLLRLAAEDPEVYRIASEVRALLKPSSVLREPAIASRVMALMAAACDAGGGVQRRSPVLQGDKRMSQMGGPASSRATPAAMDDTFTVDISGTTPAIPEPSTWAMLLMGFGGVGGLAWAGLCGHARRACEGAESDPAP